MSSFQSLRFTTWRFGLDSIPSISSRITPMLFQPPPFPENVDKSVVKSLRYEEDRYGNKTTYRIFRPLTISKKYIIWSHGNGCDILTMESILDNYVKIFGVNIICYDYPGYTFSTGEQNEHGCYNALNVIVELTKTFTSVEDITLVGHSLGSGVVVDYAANHQWSSPIILISPYKSILRVVYDRYFLSAFVESLIGNYGFKSINKIHNVTCPVRIIHGDSDYVIDISHGEELYENLPNKSFKPVWIQGADHNTTLDKIKYNDIAEILFYEKI